MRQLGRTFFASEDGMLVASKGLWGMAGIVQWFTFQRLSPSWFLSRVRLGITIISESIEESALSGISSLHSCIFEDPRTSLSSWPCSKHALVSLQVFLG
jgi:hypothetical protein